MDVLGSGELSFESLIKRRVNMTPHGSADVRRYPVYLVEASGRKLKILVKIENESKMAFACGAVSQQPDVV